MALPHVGSWEFGGAFLATQGLPMTSVAERIEPPELFEFFVEQRAAMGLTIVPLDSSSGSAVMSTLRRGGLVGLLSDRDLAGNGIEVEFFGETTTMPAGPGHLGPPQRSATGHRGRLQRPRSGSLAPSCSLRSTPPGTDPCGRTWPG